ncbi:nitroreductase family protein [Promicromonospora sp. NPDC090134]|uniref:nitroreductase family protein n=1 Tax=Promicromonospora sp. NPDC090134 TaxID=3364408 RepID=UPI0037FF4FE1
MTEQIFPTLGLSADEVLTTTRAVRKRLDHTRAVPRDLIQECVHIATQAPSGRNRQQWDFVFIDDPATKLDVARLWHAGLTAGAPGDRRVGPPPSRMSFASPEWARIVDSLGHLARHLHEMPVLMIPTLRVTDRTDLETVRGQAGSWGSAVPAFWSFMLAARERGLGTAWTTAHLTYEREMADLLGLPFETVVQVALTPVAYTVGTDFKPGPRADAEEFTHWNRW